MKKNRMFALDKTSEFILSEVKKRGVTYSKCVRDSLIAYAGSHGIAIPKEKIPEDMVDEELVALSTETGE